jgi:hypothetical protein
MLDDLRLTFSANQCLTELGIDSYDQCLDKEFYSTYPYSIFYFFNSRGFRDNEWPSQIENQIWCVGDSFTVGLGQPFEHTWHQQLKQISASSTINISLNGASNDWISRKACYILQHANPKAVSIQWSYLHRRENKNKMLLDEQRLMHHDPSDPNDVENFLKNISLVESFKKDTPVIHSFIPKFNNIDDENNNDTLIYNQLEKQNINFFPNINPVDKARDGHHYGEKTALLYAKEYSKRLMDAD